MERVPRADTEAEVVMDHLRTPRRGAMDRAVRMAAGARDRTPHRTLQAGARTAVAAVVTVAAEAVTAAVVDTEDSQ